MRAVRSDVRAKLLYEYLKLKRTNDQQGGYHYHTSRAVHYIRAYNGVYYFNTIGYDGTRYHSEEAIL